MSAASCCQHGSGQGSVGETLDVEISNFMTLAERALALRAETIKEGTRLQGRMAQGSGVEMNNLQHFLNIDSIGILRKPGLWRESRARTIIQALRQVGKPYDFNFDVESKERVYCSKLVYLSYSGIDWPTKKTLGRATFTPDDVASKAAPGGDLQLVTFYHDGNLVTDKPLEQMVKLMGVQAEK